MKIRSTNITSVLEDIRVIAPNIFHNSISTALYIDFFVSIVIYTQHREISVVRSSLVTQFVKSSIRYS